MPGELSSKHIVQLKKAALCSSVAPILTFASLSEDSSVCQQEEGTLHIDSVAKEVELDGVTLVDEDASLYLKDEATLNSDGDSVAEEGEVEDVTPLNEEATTTEKLSPTGAWALPNSKHSLDADNNADEADASTLLHKEATTVEDVSPAWDSVSPDDPEDTEDTDDADYPDDTDDTTSTNDGDSVITVSSRSATSTMNILNLFRGPPGRIASSQKAPMSNPLEDEPCYPSPEEQERVASIRDANTYIYNVISSCHAWRDRMEIIWTTCPLTLAELHDLGNLVQTQGVAATRKLIRAPVIHDSIALYLWQHLASRLHGDNYADVLATKAKQDSLRERSEAFQAHRAYVTQSKWKRAVGKETDAPPAQPPVHPHADLHERFRFEKPSPKSGRRGRRGKGEGKRKGKAVPLKTLEVVRSPDVVDWPELVVDSPEILLASRPRPPKLRRRSWHDCVFCRPGCTCDICMYGGKHPLNKELTKIQDEALALPSRRELLQPDRDSRVPPQGAERQLSFFNQRRNESQVSSIRWHGFTPSVRSLTVSEKSQPNGRLARRLGLAVGGCGSKALVAFGESLAHGYGCKPPHGKHPAKKSTPLVQLGWKVMVVVGGSLSRGYGGHGYQRTCPRKPPAVYQIPGK